MTQSEGFFRKVGKTLGLVSDPAPASADRLIKLNLPPCMGRRDAALDRLAIPEDIFTRPAEERHKIYRRVGALASSAVEDTRAILRMLSSPDTKRREGRLEAILLIDQEMTDALIGAAHVQMLLAARRPEGCTSDTDDAVSRCESMLLNEFREILATVRPQIDRYRGYTGKSFSPANLERYRKSYERSGEYFDSPVYPEGR